MSGSLVRGQAMLPAARSATGHDVAGFGTHDDHVHAPSLRGTVAAGLTIIALFFGGFLLLGGRAADLLGRRRLFLAGVVLFTTASLVSGLAWGEGPLIGARAFQGLGAAIITPAALSILMTTFAEGKEDDDTLIEQNGVRIVVDPMSAMYIKGSEIDFVDALMGGGFALRNPNAVSSCGCGQSFRTAEQSGTAKACAH